ncbi:unnamed protein product [Didymodactylos carnosus]|uniref:Nicotinate phosphoribosyltransferase n=1 Tax=Didymodactylos carnosus TaxID=1234261 RepID=A0A813NP03_9BILA|nr:unnamed protein product [Didymodactylos carnosus]CAF0871007.1 unnamed protein product [Didymodactylos carnosus]CAF3521037.1 unnamed protein product [Didymodactylos carnosus]CAF3655859.1 unnamed protein product [Didymodactylos carnosus]
MAYGRGHTSFTIDTLKLPKDSLPLAVTEPPPVFPHITSSFISSRLEWSLLPRELRKACRTALRDAKKTQPQRIIKPSVTKKTKKIVRNMIDDDIVDLNKYGDDVEEVENEEAEDQTDEKIVDDDGTINDADIDDEDEKKAKAQSENKKKLTDNENEVEAVDDEQMEEDMASDEADDYIRNYDTGDDDLENDDSEGEGGGGQTCFTEQSLSTTTLPITSLAASSFPLTLNNDEIVEEKNLSNHNKRSAEQWNNKSLSSTEILNAKKKFIQNGNDDIILDHRTNKNSTITGNIDNDKKIDLTNSSPDEPSSTTEGQTESLSSASPPQTPIYLMSSSQQSSVVQPLLTDLYQISMAYAYWKGNKYQDIAVFDLYFRKNPFGGEYTLFAGLEECLKFVRDYKFHSTDIDYLKTILPQYVEKEFFAYLSQLVMDDIKIYAVPEGTVVFPRIPLLRVEGPILKTQLLETTFLTLINYASLVATNAARFRSATGADKTLLEFGLRRAQGPDGGLSASRYCYIGGFDGTSNVLAGKLYGIPIKGTHAHAYVNSYSAINDLSERDLCDRRTGEKRPFTKLCLQYLDEIGPVLKFMPEEVNHGELAAFISYAIAFPSNFLALVDTYDVLKSGVPNFLAVARALHECSYQAVGLRLDSGDLAYLSLEVRSKFQLVAQKFNLPYMEHFMIVASNDINEETLISLEKQGHSIDTFGVGTHLVTCQKQPALGCVYKLVELNGSPRIKVSQDIEKVTIPGRKNVYRLFGHDGKALCDLLTRHDEVCPVQTQRILSRHPFSEQRRAYVNPTSVLDLYKLYWADNQIKIPLPTLKEVKMYAKEQIESLRKDHKRDLNPTPYKVSVTNALFEFMHSLWMKSVPIGELE